MWRNVSRESSCVASRLFYMQSKVRQRNARHLVSIAVGIIFSHPQTFFVSQSASYTFCTLFNVWSWSSYSLFNSTIRFTIQFRARASYASFVRLALVVWISYCSAPKHVSYRRQNLPSFLPFAVSLSFLSHTLRFCNEACVIWDHCHWYSWCAFFCSSQK